MSKTECVKCKSVENLTSVDVPDVAICQACLNEGNLFVWECGDCKKVFGSPEFDGGGLADLLVDLEDICSSCSDKRRFKCEKCEFEGDADAFARLDTCQHLCLCCNAENEEARRNDERAMREM